MSEEQVEYTPEVVPDASETPDVLEPPAEPEVDLKAEHDKLLKKVENLARENKNLLKKQQVMADQTKFIIESSVKQKLSELGNAKDQAVEEGDKQRVREIDSQIEEVKAQSAKVTSQPPSLDPSIQNFIDDNPWFNSDADMTEFAIAFNESYLRRHPGDLDKSLEATLEKVKKAFPEKFEQAEKKEDKKAAPSPVEGSTKQVSGNRYTMARLSEEQKIAYDQYVKKHKIMTHEDYFKSLDDAGYLA